MFGRFSAPCVSAVILSACFLLLNKLVFGQKSIYFLFFLKFLLKEFFFVRYGFLFNAVLSCLNFFFAFLLFILLTFFVKN